MTPHTYVIRKGLAHSGARIQVVAGKKQDQQAGTKKASQLGSGALANGYSVLGIYGLMSRCAVLYELSGSTAISPDKNGFCQA